MPWKFNPKTGLWDFASVPTPGERLTSTGNRSTSVTENRYAVGRNGAPSSTAKPGIGKLHHRPKYHRGTQLYLWRLRNQ